MLCSWSGADCLQPPCLPPGAMHLQAWWQAPTSWASCLVAGLCWHGTLPKFLQSNCDLAPDSLTLMCRAAHMPTLPSQVQLGTTSHREEAGSDIEGESLKGDSPRQAVSCAYCQQQAYDRLPSCVASLDQLAGWETAASSSRGTGVPRMLSRLLHL